MTTTHVIEGEIVDEAPLAVRVAAPPVSWTPSFAVAVDDAIARKQEKRRFFLEVMEEGLHYGVIPGTSTKPTLFKAGAEMLLANMGLNPVGADATPPIIDVLGSDHGGEAYIRYDRTCRIYRQVGLHVDERMLVAELGGVCSSWEVKYRYRTEKRKCPTCGKATIIEGKAEYGGGFICWKKPGKSDGCGAKFQSDDPRILSQPFGKVPNPDVAELENTIKKMADKRALVAATLVATGCSDIFTQDVEDARGDDALESAAYANVGDRDGGERGARPQDAPESPQAPATPILASGVLLDQVTRGFKALELFPVDRSDRLFKATEGRLNDPDHLELLYASEANRLARMLVKEFNDRETQPTLPVEEEIPF